MQDFFSNRRTLPPPFRVKRSLYPGFRIFLVLIFLLGTAVLLSGCSELVLLDPKGPIGKGERFVIITAFILMLIVVIPVFIMAFLFPWKYRAGNVGAKYAPRWSYSAKIELAVWLIPAVIVAALGILIWNTTYDLDPYKPLVSDKEPVVIEAVSLDWKWLFIYPDHDIAVVNELVFPTGVPLNFRLTSDTVMTSFFIPQLGSQIYAMGGMETKLHLMADEAGTFRGQNQQLSGDGYSHMHFKATATSDEQFQEWLAMIKETGDPLDQQRYEKLQQPSEGYYPVTYFSSVTPDLFISIIRKYHPNFGRNGHGHGSHAKPVGMEGE